MTLTRANPSNWGVKDELTSTQTNHMDSEIAKAVDGTGGGTYTGNVDLDNFEGRVRTGKELTVDDGGDVRWDGSTKTQLPRTSARVYHYAVPLVAVSSIDWVFPAPQYSASPDNSSYQWRQTDVTTPLDGLVFAIPYPSYETGLTLRGVRVHLTGASVDGHSGTPSVGVKGSAQDIEMPEIRLISKSSGGSSIGGLYTLLDTVDDPSANLAAYEDRHTIDTEVDGGGALTDNPLVSGTTGKQYFVHIFGENGTGAENNEVAVYQIESFWNITRIGP